MSNTKSTYLKGKGATPNRHYEETDNGRRHESNDFKVQPGGMDESMISNSLQRSAKKFFHRQTITSPPRDDVQEDDVEAAQGTKFEVVLQASKKPDDEATVTTPPVQRPPTLFPSKQNAIELDTQQ